MSNSRYVTADGKKREELNEVLEGFECGIGVQGFTAFETADIIEVYEIKEIKRSLV